MKFQRGEEKQNKTQSLQIINNHAARLFSPPLTSFNFKCYLKKSLCNQRQLQPHSFCPVIVRVFCIVSLSCLPSSLFITAVIIGAVQVYVTYSAVLGERILFTARKFQVFALSLEGTSKGMTFSRCLWKLWGRKEQEQRRALGVTNRLHVLPPRMASKGRGHRTTQTEAPSGLIQRLSP